MNQCKECPIEKTDKQVYCNFAGCIKKRVWPNDENQIDIAAVNGEPEEFKKIHLGEWWKSDREVALEEACLKYYIESDNEMTRSNDRILWERFIRWATTNEYTPSEIEAARKNALKTLEIRESKRDYLP